MSNLVLTPVTQSIPAPSASQGMRPHTPQDSDPASGLGFQSALDGAGASDSSIRKDFGVATAAAPLSRPVMASNIKPGASPCGNTREPPSAQSTDTQNIVAIDGATRGSAMTETGKSSKTAVLFALIRNDAPQSAAGDSAATSVYRDDNLTTGWTKEASGRPLNHTANAGPAHSHSADPSSGSDAASNVSLSPSIMLPQAIQNSLVIFPQDSPRPVASATSSLVRNNGRLDRSTPTQELPSCTDPSVDLPPAGSDTSLGAIGLPVIGGNAPETTAPNSFGSMPALQSPDSSTSNVSVAAVTAGAQLQCPATSHGSDGSAARLLSMLAPTPVNPGIAVPMPLQPGTVSLPLAQDVPVALPLQSTTLTSSLTATVEQLKPAIISLATRTDGASEMTVSLNPRDLGQVDVHLVRGTDGTTAVTITASEPATLQELSQNAHHLHAALDAASVPTDGRTIDFVVASVDAAGRDQNHGGSSLSADSTSQERGSDASGGQGQPQGHQQPLPLQQTQHRRSDDVTSGIYDPSAPLASRRRWQLGGLNITA